MGHLNFPRGNNTHALTRNCCNLEWEWDDEVGFIYALLSANKEEA